MRNPLLLMILRFSVFWLIIALLSAQHVVAQWVEKVELSGERSVLLSRDQPIHAIVVRGDSGLFRTASLLAGSVTYKFTPDEHFSPQEGWLQSNLIAFSKPITELIFKDLPHTVTQVYLIRQNALQQTVSEFVTALPCESPPVISQTEWRAGLPVPDYTRIRTQVRHIIIHHSATSNTLTNYTDLVRSIYLQHTQVNEWSDIGYNYLIAPDGTIYAGRDPGVEMQQDEVLGAHFCASNSGTLGICMLGTYMDILPTDSAMSSLYRLLAWKTAKDSLSPYGFLAHPRNPLLGVIAGHRDGCATLCPGDALYTHLHPVKESCNALLEACGVFLGSNETAEIKWEVHPNPGSGSFINISVFNFPNNVTEYTIKIFNQFGLIVADFGADFSTGQVMVPIDLKAGMYFLQIRFANQAFVKKILRL